MTEPGDDAVKTVLDEFLACGEVPGVAACVFRADGIVAQAGRGVSSTEPPRPPMTARTVGVVHSLSKVMTATALTVAAAEKVLDLDEPIVKHLPDIRGRDRFATTTVRHLLTHTAGLVRGPVPVTAPISAAGLLDQYVLGGCLAAPRFGEPGEVFGYSDTGIVLAGYVLQRAVGAPFPRAMHEVLFEPAGMTRTTLDPFTAMTFPLTQQHLRGGGEVTVHRRFDVHPMLHPASGVFSCVEDLARLGIVHLGGAPILADPSVLHEPFVDVGLDVVRDFGLGVAIGPRYGDAMSAGHEGHHAGAWAKLQLIPEFGMGAAWLDNRGDEPDLSDLREVYFDRLLALLGAGPRSWRRDKQGDPGPLDAAGRYARPTGKPLEVTKQDNGFRVTDGMTAVGYHHFDGRIFVSAPDAELPSRIPWAPDRDSRRSALCVVGPADAPTHILMNGLPYQRCR